MEAHFCLLSIKVMMCGVLEDIISPMVFKKYVVQCLRDY